MHPTRLLIIICSLIACDTPVDQGREDHIHIPDTTMIVTGEVDTEIINGLMDRWHKAAAEADGQTYFGLMADDAIYLGTDKSERWTKSGFRDFAMPYFDRGKAWNFIAHDRHVLLAENGRTAWLDEQLDTWMGPCRGTAVLRLEGGDWKIVHYDLSYMVDNEQMDAVIELTGSAPPRIRATDSTAVD